jgi:hypothetical protein
MNGNEANEEGHARAREAIRTESFSLPLFPLFSVPLRLLLGHAVEANGSSVWI